MDRFTRALYVVIGVAALAAGIAVVVSPRLILTPDVYTGLTAHLMREEGALFVFVGLMSLWCWRHYSARRPVHLGLLAFATIFAGIHLWGYLQDPHGIQGVVINMVPVALLAITTPWRETAT